MNARKQYDAFVAAAQAHTTLETFAAVERLLEQGVFGASGQRTAERIRRLCEKERMFQILVFDGLTGREAAMKPATQGEQSHD